MAGASSVRQLAEAVVDPLAALLEANFNLSPEVAKGLVVCLWFILAYVGYSLTLRRRLASVAPGVLLGRGGKWWERSGPPSVPLLGPSEGGKTALFYALTLDEGEPMVDTVSSLTANEAVGAVDVSEGEVQQVRFVDFPGHERLRGGAAKLIGAAAERGGPALIIVLDSADKSSIKASAELLYDIMIAPRVTELAGEGYDVGASGDESDDEEDDKADSRLRVIVAANKSDHVEARSAEAVKEGLERDIERLRRSRAAMLEGQSGATLPTVGDGDGDDGHFGFSVAPIRVTFVETSAKKRDVAALQKALGRALARGAKEH
eukprot:Selendium_serpulae@DN3048_c0_g1_i1.p1